MTQIEFVAKAAGVFSVLACATFLGTVLYLAAAAHIEWIADQERGRVLESRKRADHEVSLHIRNGVSRHWTSPSIPVAAENSNRRSVSFVTTEGRGVHLDIGPDDVLVVE